MNAKLTLKWIDIAGQLLMLFPLVVALAGDALSPIAILGRSRGFLAYFSVGAWQVLSLLLHLIADPEGRARRRSYARVLVTTALLLGVAIFGAVLGNGLELRWLRQLGGGLLLVILSVLLLAAPVLAVWYFRICIRELQQHRSASAHRREIHWKL